MVGCLGERKIKNNCATMTRVIEVTNTNVPIALIWGIDISLQYLKDNNRNGFVLTRKQTRRRRTHRMIPPWSGTIAEIIAGLA